MSAERDSVITRLRQSMKEAPLPVAAPQRPERRILADGYERQTLEETLLETEQYRHRVPRAILRLIIIAAVVSALALAILKSGIISL